MPLADTFDFRKRLRPKSYSFALYFVGIFILIQIAALVSVFFLRKAVVKIESQGPALAYKKQESVAAPAPIDIKWPEARLDTLQPGSKEARIMELNDQAREFRRQNDFMLAQAALIRALDIDPSHATTLINIAMLEEAKGDDVKALEYWQQLVQSGQSSNPSILRLAKDRVVAMEEKIRQQKTLSEQREKQIIKTPRKFYVDRVIARPNPLPENPSELEYDFLLRAGIEPLESSKMRIQVFFYDRVAERDLVPARVDAKFIDQKPKWSKNVSETLKVKYQRTRDGTKENRVFFGYLIRLIYDNEVQDEQANPAELLQLFPFQAPLNNN